MAVGGPTARAISSSMPVTSVGRLKLLLQPLIRLAGGITRHTLFSRHNGFLKSDFVERKGIRWSWMVRIGLILSNIFYPLVAVQRFKNQKASDKQRESGTFVNYLLFR
jgi:hypothetical protein